MVGETSRSRFHRRARACPSPSLAQSNTRGGQAPALRYAMPSPFTVVRGPVPRRAWVGTGTGLGRRVFFARVERSRGTGPRATVVEAASFPRRAWALGCHTRMRAGFPRRASVGTGTGLGRRVVFARVERSRGTGPRATVVEAAVFHRRAWALACHTCMRAGFPRHRACTRNPAHVCSL